MGSRGVTLDALHSKSRTEKPVGAQPSARAQRKGLLAHRRDYSGRVHVEIRPPYISAYLPSCSAEAFGQRSQHG